MAIDDKTRVEPRAAWAVALGVGWELVAWSLVGFGAGWAIDAKLGSSPWGLIVATLGGIFAGLYRLVRTFSVPPAGRSGRG